MSIHRGAEGAKTCFWSPERPTPSPQATAHLVAALIAAHQAGDREQERRILRELRDDHGLRIGFASKLKGGLE